MQNGDRGRPRDEFQHHTNRLRAEKQQVQNRMRREMSIQSHQPRAANDGGPSQREVSGLSGHRIIDGNDYPKGFEPVHHNVDTSSSQPQPAGETFTSLGKVLNQRPRYHFENQFFDPTVLSEATLREEKQEFRKYIETERRNEDRLRKLAVADNDLLKSNAFNPASKTFLENPMDQVDTTKTPFNNPFENTRYNKVRRSVINIDSVQRNKTLYPNPNNYKISLPRSYQHVKQVSLVSTEIPNTDRVVRDDPPEVKRARNRRIFKCGELLNQANNNLYWINAEDADEDYSCLIYNAPLTPGNYVAIDCECDQKTIQEEIEERVAQVNHFDDGTPHQFLVTVDTRTNIVTITSIESDQLELDPISTEAGTNIVTVTHTNHGFTTGDPVTIIGSTSVGGVPADVIDGTHEITNIIDANTYEFRITTIATFTATGGGANVLAGQQKPFKLLFSNVDTIGSILGFPQQDSSEAVARAIEFIDIDPPDSMGNPTTPGTQPAQIYTESHCLNIGDEILITDTDTIPDINGLQTVTNIISANVFEVGIPVKVVNNQTTTTSTRIGQLKRSLDPMITNVTLLTMAMNGFIETANVNTFTAGTTVFIGNVVGGTLIGGNSINGIHTIDTTLTNRRFRLEDEIGYAGDYANGFVFETSSTELTPITGIVANNNGSERLYDFPEYQYNT